MTDVRSAVPPVVADRHVLNAGVTDGGTRETIAALLRRLIEEVSALIRMELRLARSELGASVKAAISGVVAIALGAVLAMIAMTCLLVATVVWLADHIGLLAAVLGVGGVLAVVAAILIFVGIGKMQRLELAPRRTIANLKGDADLLKGD